MLHAERLGNLEKQAQILSPGSVIVKGEILVACDLAVTRRHCFRLRVDIRSVNAAEAFTRTAALKERGAPQLGHCWLERVDVMRRGRRVRHAAHAKTRCRKIVAAAVI